GLSPQRVLVGHPPAYRCHRPHRRLGQTRSIAVIDPVPTFPEKAAPTAIGAAKNGRRWRKPARPDTRRGVTTATRSTFVQIALLASALACGACSPSNVAPGPPGGAGHR